MKKTIQIVLLLLVCFAIVGNAYAVGCGNEHYYNCGGGIGNDGTEYHAPGTNQRFKCYQHVAYNEETTACKIHEDCLVTTKDIWHRYKCMRCSYGSDGSYEAFYRTTTTHSK